ncbi:MAG: protein-L-isoaspartate O-methyltransferase [Desulfuromonas sp.]|uniref:protein-L-isoaspartate(D-aspartate) O-methyltransferase n=1 Tax=Desulfuromonas sp. TaxID=892 RepID=UPI000CC47499|nr:protein-L-isoaspartate(D-aspartate) O-methyltransferase [Desulfuromonas sp.]PLX84299.1 MAG: protein-L-isoaspartate O-methyltransferase [Desulfuromonas sp.]
MISRRDRIEGMLNTIEHEYQTTLRYTGRRAANPKVLDAMGLVPREEFVPQALKPSAYANNALPIGDGQTISQPFIVALMTDLLCPEKDHVVLEVGAGSGYQAAVLSVMVRQVYSVEIVPALAIEAAERLARLGYNNVEIRSGDGYRGWAEHAPFDGIIVTAAVPHLPPALLDQLRPGGRLVVPVGMPYMHQELMAVEKDQHGVLHTRDVLGVIFVPLTGEGGAPG